MLYFGFRAISPKTPIARSAATAFAIALCDELFRLHHQPALDALRLTLAGKLLLGRIFSP